MNIQTIKRNSQTALCGAFEKEIVVNPSEVSQVKATLRQNGFMIVGTGPGAFGKTKIWYNPIGMMF